MKKIYFYVSYMCSVVAFVGLLSTMYAAASPVNLTQKINPRICIVDKIADYDGSVVTMNTKGCGTLIYPEDFNSENGTRLPLTNQIPLTGAKITKQYVPWTTNDPSLGQPTDSSVPSNQNSIYISGPEGVDKPGGFLIIASKGTKYMYRLFGDNPILEPRFFEIKNIQGGEVEIYFQDASQIFRLQNGQGTFVDVAYDSLADISLVVEDIETTSNATAAVRVEFPWQPRMEDKILGTTESFIAVTAIGILSAFAVVANVGHRRRNAHIPIPTHWHFIQHIENIPKNKPFISGVKHTHKVQH